METTKESIISVAQELFYGQGYESSSVANIIDAVGDFGPPYAGGRIGNDDDAKVYSMERLDMQGEGTDPSNWRACTLEEGGANVNERFRDIVIATPGEPNSQ